MLYRGLRPKTKVFYSRFRRNVWHPGWGKRGPKMVSLNRPGHAVVPFGGRLFGARPERFWCDIVAKAKSELHCYSLASGWGDMYVKNGSVELARPCCFLVWRGAFCTENRLGEPVRPCCFPVASKSWFRVRVVGKLQGNLQNLAKIVYSFFSESRRTFLTPGVAPAQVKKRVLELARPCCFPVPKGAFLGRLVPKGAFLGGLFGQKSRCTSKPSLGAK